VLVIRVLWVIAALAGGVGVAAYVICWLRSRATRIPRRCRTLRSRRNRRRNAIVIAAIVLIGLGFVNLLGGDVGAVPARR
jgi:hypothetical protein